MVMVNEKNKDRLFSFIFGNEGNKRWTLDLYNAINGSDYDDPEEIELNTMNDTVYMGMRNDLSFIIRADMSIWAHQSTYNPNMPLRELMYIGRVFDKYVHQKRMNIYGSKLIVLPVPKIVVFYNGTRDAKDEMILNLSDAFYDGVDPSESDVQVRVRMLNINYGRNKELMNACRPLMEYSWFVMMVRTNKKNGMDIEDAVDKAVDDMPDDYLIKLFLVGNRAEVKSMCITEYDEEETMNLFKEEGREEGREEGIRGIIALCRKMNGSEIDVVESVVSTYGVTEDEAKVMVRKYW